MFLVVKIDKDNIKEQISCLKDKDLNDDLVFTDYVIQGITIKDVPTLIISNQKDDYAFSGQTLDTLLTLVSAIKKDNKHITEIDFPKNIN